MKSFKCSFSVLLLFAVTYAALAESKYSKSANEKKSKNEIDFRALEKPFRMNKLNLIWKKAQQRLSEPKLKSLYNDFMIHDKEEITYKRFKSDGGDKEGLKEAELRRKLTTIMSVYGLRQHFDTQTPGKQQEHAAFNSAVDDHINRSLFKDKKLNQLWAKAELSGFTNEELSALKEEFQHHQDKIDQYYEVLDKMDVVNTDEFQNAINQDELEKYNEIMDNSEPTDANKEYLDKNNLVRVKHRGLRDGFDRLHRITARGPNNKEFIEPKVQGLWKMATESNFTVTELESLKIELHHYESRLLKLRTLHADHVSNMDKYSSKIAMAGDKLDHLEDQQTMIKKHTRKVEKMHQDIESKILARHSEL